jgi:hypothetical protein
MELAESLKSESSNSNVKSCFRRTFGVTRFVWDANRLLCEQRGSHTRTYVYGEDAFVLLARVDTVADADGAA